VLRDISHRQRSGLTLSLITWCMLWVYLCAGLCLLVLGSDGGSMRDWALIITGVAMIGAVAMRAVDELHRS